MPLHVQLGDFGFDAHEKAVGKIEEDGRELYARKISVARPFVVLRAGFFVRMFERRVTAMLHQAPLPLAGEGLG
ncbi:hypothetical protein [Lysobacter enzymogenes]|uniref:hypothetical protein n=1 Tax=Lysobacter enzymogenes TaxID=69 RepID=UPI001A968C91|nr:hypothetical protein [Lysobacter enzymogenes]QQP94363.1 hypothetical protein JHW38_13890 [Lysobacter enzymogenes]